MDHIATMLEFLQYLCQVCADAVVVPENVSINEETYQQFYDHFFSAFSKNLARAVQEQSEIGFYKAAARVLELV